ncbi:MAG: WD40/YVTN/BNR-like repeat-containing protein [Chloroflexota bacterium]
MMILGPAAAAVLSVCCILVFAQPSRQPEMDCAPESGWTSLGVPEVHVERSVGATKTQAIAASWAHERTLYAGGWRGLYVSHDCGNSWAELTPIRVDGRTHANQGAEVLAVGPGDRIYLGSPPPRPFVISDDGGETWRSASGDAPLVLVAPSDSSIAYRFVRTRWKPLFQVTRDAGRTWEALDAQFPTHIVDRRLIIDPSNSETLYLFGADDAWRSLNSGLTFTEYTRYSRGSGLDQAGISISVSRDGSRLWLTSRDDGPLRLSRDLGRTWQDVGSVPGGDYVTQVSASPHDNRVVYVVTERGDLWAYREPVTAPAQIPDRQINGVGHLRECGYTDQYNRTGIDVGA